jgi:hypothetical protein
LKGKCDQTHTQNSQYVSREIKKINDSRQKYTEKKKESVSTTGMQTENAHSDSHHNIFSYQIMK